MATFIARFSGTLCDNCDERVQEGQEVQYNAAGHLIHAACPETQDAATLAPQGACPDCHMELLPSGTCGWC